MAECRAERSGKRFGKCNLDMTVRWHTEVGSNVYAAPLITDLYSDGHKDVVIPGFHRELFLLDGRTGGVDTEFEGTHRSSLFSSPLLYDIDFDGVLDLVVPTYNGRVQFYKDTVRLLLLSHVL